jgi:hypothetical protein
VFCGTGGRGCAGKKDICQGCNQKISCCMCKTYQMPVSALRQKAGLPLVSQLRVMRACSVSSWSTTANIKHLSWYGIHVEHARLHASQFMVGQHTFTDERITPFTILTNQHSTLKAFLDTRCPRESTTPATLMLTSAHIC